MLARKTITKDSSKVDPNRRRYGLSTTSTRTRLWPNKPGENEKLPLDMTIRVFRTYKGNIEKLISGKLVFRNPENEVESDPFIFTSSKSFRSTGRKFRDRSGRRGS